MAWTKSLTTYFAGGGDPSTWLTSIWSFIVVFQPSFPQIWQIYAFVSLVPPLLMMFSLQPITSSICSSSSFMFLASSILEAVITSTLIWSSKHDWGRVAIFSLWIGLSFLWETVIGAIGLSISSSKLVCWPLLSPPYIFSPWNPFSCSSVAILRKLLMLSRQMFTFP